VRVRYLGAALAAVLALTGLAGCKTNIGTAAVIDGHRVTESDVSHYLTADAQPVVQQDPNTRATTRVSPRSFVVSWLINAQLYRKVMSVIPSVSNVTEAQLDSQLQDDLAGESVTHFAESHGLHGFTDAFYQVVLHTQEVIVVLQNARSNGVDVGAAFNKLNFPVSVSPRYGSWDGKQFLFTSGAALPGYLDVQPGGTQQGLAGNS
jgi:hypothetical protein